MADNINPRNTSAKDAMMAEIIVTELEQFKNSHRIIMENAEKILSQYNNVERLAVIMDKRDTSLAEAIKRLSISSDEYFKLTELSMLMAKELKEIDEEGIGIQPDSLDKVIAAVQKANEPIRKHIRWLTYGVGLAFFLLAVLAILV